MSGGRSGPSLVGSSVALLPQVLLQDAQRFGFLFRFLIFHDTFAIHQP